MSGGVHILGAGLSGLAAAVRLSGAGIRVDVYEAAAHAGGRCRSYRDETLDRMIDNGNHLVLSGNGAVMTYLRDIGAAATIAVETPARFPFLDLDTMQRWTVQPDTGRIPWSWLSRARRVPGAGLMDYLRGWRLSTAADSQRIADVMPTTGPLWERFWAPVIVAVTNTDPAQASAGPMGRVVRETLAVGEAACRPVMFPDGLGESLVEPAVAYVEGHGGHVHFRRRVRGVAFDAGRATKLDVNGGVVEIAEADHVLSALPAPVAAEVIADIRVPDQFMAIVNGHFRLPAPVDAPPILGLLGGTAEWLFHRGDVVSVTVSAAEALVGRDSDEIAAAMWRDIVRAYDLADRDLPPHRIIKEKRATFRQTPDQMRLRPEAATDRDNVWLAGDWTQTHLPATIEGSIRSGNRAAELILERL